jgi:hypothetical protein
MSEQTIERCKFCRKVSRARRGAQPGCTPGEHRNDARGGFSTELMSGSCGTGH